jgi:hypothetical protein
MIPRLSYGSGWPVHVDLADLDGTYTPAQVAALWGELCRLADLLGCGSGFVLRFQTFAPQELYPGYYARAKVLLTGDWMVNANGTTPVNAAEWSDPWHSPYYATPTVYVKAGVGVLSPELVAHATVHELFHLLMPYGQHGHNTEVGWIFGAGMKTLPGVDMVTPLAGRRLADSVWHLARGYRVMAADLVVVPHLLAPDMPRPGPAPQLLPDFAPPTAGPVRRVRDGAALDLGASRPVYRPGGGTT